MREFQLSSINFHPCQTASKPESKAYFIYVKEPTISYSNNQATPFFNALQLSNNEEKDEELTSLRSIATNNHQAIELHFRSKKDRRIIAVTIHLPCFTLDITSYVWQYQRRAYQKLSYPEHLEDEKLVIHLLQRIYIKHKEKITFLSYKKSGLLGKGARNMKQNN